MPDPQPGADDAGTATSEPQPDQPDQPDQPEAPLLDAPRDGVPPVIETEAALEALIADLRAGSGPVAVDAERASGYRYGQRAFLVQLRRAGAGTALIDPVALPDLSALSAALDGVEWILHAANQDLPCLAEVGLHPSSLFDTELAARIAGLERVGLGAVVEELLGMRLAKEHSAADWSTRPLPEPWLRYAALDVELLDDLRDALAERLAEQGKTEWARQEFEAVRTALPPGPRVDPWRRTSGMHQVRGRRGLAAVRELWLARDAMARARDVSPGRVLPDSAIVAAAKAMPATVAGLTALPVFSGRMQRRQAERWFAAIDRARSMEESELPPTTLRSDAPPPPRMWADRDPVAAQRLTDCRAAVAEVAERTGVPSENLVSPDTVRRLCWRPPADVSEAGLREALTASGARAWQVDLVAGAFAAAFAPA